MWLKQPGRPLRPPRSPPRADSADDLYDSDRGYKLSTVIDFAIPKYGLRQTIADTGDRRDHAQAAHHPVLLTCAATWRICPDVTSQYVSNHEPLGD
jgi:hypothetical protein